MAKKIILGILGVLALGIVIVLGVAAMEPDTFRVERTAATSASPEAVYRNLEDFHRWSAWSPWEKLDPNMTRTFGGSERGVGATYAWSGNDDVGKGKMTITESRPNEQLEIRLEFQEPFASTSTTIFTVTPKNGGSEISWAMEGPNTFPGKIMSVFVDMDSMIGRDFEEGLANLKRVSESNPARAAN